MDKITINSMLNEESPFQPPTPESMDKQGQDVVKNSARKTAEPTPNKGVSPKEESEPKPEDKETPPEKEYLGAKGSESYFYINRKMGDDGQVNDIEILDAEDNHITSSSDLNIPVDDIKELITQTAKKTELTTLSWDVLQKYFLDELENDNEEVSDDDQNLGSVSKKQAKELGFKGGTGTTAPGVGPQASAGQQRGGEYISTREAKETFTIEGLVNEGIPGFENRKDKERDSVMEKAYELAHYLETSAFENSGYILTGEADVYDTYDTNNEFSSAEVECYIGSVAFMGEDSDSLGPTLKDIASKFGAKVMWWGGNETRVMFTISSGNSGDAGMAMEAKDETEETRSKKKRDEQVVDGYKNAKADQSGRGDAEAWTNPLNQTDVTKPSRATEAKDRDVKVQCEYCGKWLKGFKVKGTNKVEAYCDKCGEDQSAELMDSKRESKVTIGSLLEDFTTAGLGKDIIKTGYMMLGPLGYALASTVAPDVYLKQLRSRELELKKQLDVNPTDEDLQVELAEIQRYLKSKEKGEKEVVLPEGKEVSDKEKRAREIEKEMEKLWDKIADLDGEEGNKDIENKLNNEANNLYLELIDLGIPSIYIAESFKKRSMKDKYKNLWKGRKAGIELRLNKRDSDQDEEEEKKENSK